MFAYLHLRIYHFTPFPFLSAPNWCALPEKQLGIDKMQQYANCQLPNPRAKMVRFGVSPVGLFHLILVIMYS